VPPEVLPVILFSAVGLLAYFVRGVTGVASAIVANACFVILVGSTGVLTLLDALYWVALVDTAATVVLLWALRGQLGLGRHGRRYLVGAVPVNVAFTLLLPRVDLAALGAGLGMVLIGAGAYLAARRTAPSPTDENLRPWALGAGAASGIVGGLYGMGGSIGVLFFSRAESDPARFRAMTTSVFAITGAILLGVLATAGAYTPERIAWAIASLPAIALGLAIGYRVHRRVSPARFRLALGGLVALSGLAGLIRTGTAL
jgi:hypothetical protein